MKRIILASSSPRRMEILKNLNLSFEVVPSRVEESTEENDPDKVAVSLATLKALDVAGMMDNSCLIIGADTIVYKDGKIYGKPNSNEEAFDFLQELSGTSHSVITGLCIIDNNSGRVITGVEETLVFFKSLSNTEIKRYINSGEPSDKAGAYGIQGIGGIFVEKIQGCYFNVVGLPINKLYRMMEELGINLIDEVRLDGK